MKAYFTASIKGKKFHLDSYLKIIEILQKKNIQVISDHIINNNENTISLESAKERINFHKQMEKWIKSVNFVIAETSFPSISVGYEIALASSLRKPILVLYKEGVHPPTLLTTGEKENLVCEKYSPNSLGDIIADFINYVEDTNDSRFTFFVSPEINYYLERISRKEKIPKSVYLRRLIKHDMLHHK